MHDDGAVDLYGPMRADGGFRCMAHAEPQQTDLARLLIAQPRGGPWCGKRRASELQSGGLADRGPDEIDRRALFGRKCVYKGFMGS
jgi:hypothetical protein